MSDQFSLENRASPAPSGAKGGIPAATSGTALAWLPVGLDGSVLTADSGVASGLSYQFPLIGTLRTLKETVFAGITPASYTTGNTYTIDGSDYTCTVAGNGAVDMVATGLRIRNGTTSGTSKTMMNIAAGNTGDFLSILGETRYRRGQWAFWTVMASYDYTHTSSVIVGSANVTGTYPKWGVSLRRTRNLGGAPNTTTGGITSSFWWNGTENNTASYPGVTTANVWMVYFRNAVSFDFYYAPWTGSWPSLESMTFWGIGAMTTSQYTIGTNTGPLAASLVGINFGLEGSAATTGTYEIIFDRFRLTTWE